MNSKNWILLKELVKTDFKLRYQGSVIGYLWSILKPIMLFAVMYMVFIRFLRFGSDVPHFAVALLLGTTVWGFFSEATSMGMVSIVTRGDLMRKISFSKPIIVLSAVTNAFINLCINLVVVLIFAAFNGVTFSFQMLYLPLLLIELLILVVGIALLLATLFVRYRDLSPVWEVVLQAGMYATPIIYSVSFVSKDHPLAAKLMFMNPMAQIIQDMRYFLIDHANVTVWQLLNWQYAFIPYVIPVIVFVIGLVLFNKHSKKFAEII
ncbi:Polysaccharide ABC transporter membrane-spanning protein [Lactococcus piscium]|uniref:Transport permease protein n=1 Tax=Pseudolactococcus carnosus TaxID=2749961 RepID=A0ABT0AVB1_9LACT|nr:ABC transporter permease [Lactococcus carnosus]MCJ1990615.1 ABC transporter permease [Lactococcus carnosus]MCJ2000515.1 ABC transporter permease [Lactococcus carnosus]MCJ2002154.1 ABC transporter permease [Lactococcus carnosus]SOB48811.1 Polysaccharide ABC transporter membrane-spanning protein [Lactococcus piscium]